MQRLQLKKLLRLQNKVQQSWIVRHSSSSQQQLATESQQESSKPYSPTKESRRLENVLPFSAFLTDKYGRQHNYLRISVSERCNLRCTYCMPEEGVPLTPTNKLLSAAEIVRVVKLFVKQGVDKVRITGGEPLLRKDLPRIIEQISSYNINSIGITTNGILLARLMPELIASGATAINISLDSLKPERFEKISRRPPAAWFKVWKAIEMATLMGFYPLKLNCVVQRGVNDDEICDFVELTRDRQLDVRFIEYMPFTGNKWDVARMVSYKDMVQTIKEKYPDFQKLDDPFNHTAKAYKIPGHLGQVGFITSMSDHFCGGCNRLRITADGNLKVCLFGNAEISLRDAMRTGTSDEKLLSLIGEAVQRKHPKHAGMLNLAKMENRPMILIGDIVHEEIPASMRSVLFLKKDFHQTKRNSTTITPSSLSFHFFTPQQLSLKYMANAYCSPTRYFSSSRPRPAQNANDKCKSKLNEVGKARTEMLTHVDSQGKASMVDVSEKKVTTREATAEARVHLSEEIFQAVASNKMKKGDVLTVAQIAGIMGAKHTSNIIPLCHPLPLQKVDVRLELQKETNSVVIQAFAKTTAKTGVEMEALTAATITALTIYDMCKSMGHSITISDIRLIKKIGGKSDYVFNSSS